MPNLIDLTGQKFGRWTVIKRSGYNKQQIMWLCKCDCGKETIVFGQSLRKGVSNSCGCLQRELIGELKKISYGLASMRQVITYYKAGAKRRGYNFELTEEQFKKITQQDCHYCGAKPNQAHKQERVNGNYIYNGIDRVDNTKGYTIDNVVPCCKTCNQAKHTLTTQEFKDWIERVHNNMLRKERKC